MFFPIPRLASTAALVVIVGASTAAVYIFMQPLIAAAAGVMLLIFRPFKIGDFVQVAGQSGTVKALSLFVTELATPDNVQIVVPNSQVWGSSVVNYSHHETRRCDLSLGIAYEDDIGKAMDHEIEGGHPQIGMEFCKKLGEKEEVLNAIAGHPPLPMRSNDPYNVI